MIMFLVFVESNSFLSSESINRVCPAWPYLLLPRTVVLADNYRSREPLDLARRSRVQILPILDLRLISSPRSSHSMLQPQPKP